MTHFYRHRQHCGDEQPLVEGDEVVAVQIEGGCTAYVQHTEQAGRGVQEMRREVEELGQCQQDIRQLHLIMSRQSRKVWDLAKARAQDFGEPRHLSRKRVESETSLCWQVHRRLQSTARASISAQIWAPTH